MHNSDADAPPVLISETGRWVMPTVTREYRTDARGGWNARTALARQLGLRDQDTIENVWSAVVHAVREGKQSTEIIRPTNGSDLGKLVIIRPARESGFAVLIVQRIEDRPPPLPTEMLAELFGYTPTEAKIAQALLQGDDPSTIAEQRGSSLETIRGHIKHVLQKSGMSSQRQLTAMLSRLATMTAPKTNGRAQDTSAEQTSPAPRPTRVTNAR